MAKPDLSEFIALSTPDSRRACKFAMACDGLDADERELLDAACAENPGRVSNSAIRKWLALRDHSTSINAIVAHRKGECACGRAA
jgi:hypothetical protein